MSRRRKAAPRNDNLRIGFLGAFGTGNFGNDASLRVAVAWFREQRPSAELTAICHAPEAVAERLGINGVHINPNTRKSRSRGLGLVVRLMRRLTDVFWMYHVVRGLDAVIVPGTGILEAGNSKPGGFPSTLLLTAVAARTAGRPFVIVSAGAEQANRPLTRGLLAWTLRLSTYRSFRDAHSRDCATRFGAPCGDDPIYPDLAYGGEPVDAVPERVAAGSVGVGVISYRDVFFEEEPTRRDTVAAAYLAKISSFVTWILDHGHPVTLLTGDLQDDAVAEAIRASVLSQRPGSSLSIARSTSLEELLSHMESTEYVVASRFHNVIAATLLSKPTISISYMPKNDVVMRTCGLGDYCQPLDQLDEERLRQQFGNLVNNSSVLTARINHARDEQNLLVQRQWITLDRELFGQPPDAQRDDYDRTTSSIA
jgi:polysaccharide pyruvyl transferase WcaK-like protein